MIRYAIRFALLSILVILCILMRSGVVRADSLGAPQPGEPGLIVASQTAVIHLPITGDNLAPISKWMVYHMSKGDRTINLVISSPGGSVDEGFRFIARMDYVKARGLAIKCYVVEQANSMAFLILLHCSERHALARSQLLWHRVGAIFHGALRAPEAQALADDLRNTDAIILKDLERIPMEHSEIMRHLELQTAHYAINLDKLAPGFFTSVSTFYPGLIEAATNPKAAGSCQPEEPEPFLFGLMYLDPTYLSNQSKG